MSTPLLQTPLFATPLLDSPLLGQEGSATGGGGGAAAALAMHRGKPESLERQRILIRVVDDQDEISMLAQTLVEAYYLSEGL